MTTRRRGQRGTTLLEAMIAMVVLLCGALGVIGINNLGLRLNDSARKMTRATAIAQDLVDNIALWPWGDARLTTGAHAEVDLTAGGAVFPGVPLAELQDGNDFQRSWTATYVDDADGDGTFDAVRVAVTVQWSTGSLTVYTTKLNPAELR
ncbi:type IV pilus modification PilV family protein [Anaeromyxobacter oryzae]|uniref:Prepilin-type N-terminal cleavage/methylation domain-containing protein n=1 Tax=Anaeromyxobacter oryzae TaxID=2918170 RepID=A0ABM7WXN2_9BACT|nr:prepilin-type N-terminal cleavage/methylation domain-containing protein [Anaeromyxobacter oryzae]BDG04280.1 hypothetical protein AMOR_32760 [Anaeromyxobacter oryzae]